MNERVYDIVVVGGGIVGLTLARALAMDKNKTVCVLEKENELGRHASGHNSGVLHAGIYYGPGSLKARCCVEGARRMRAYAEENNIPCKKTGKVIVATSPESSAEIEKLLKNATQNGVRVEKIDEKRLQEIEPEAKSNGEALYSPDTAVIDPAKVMQTLEKEIQTLGVTVEKNSEARSIDMKKKTVHAGKKRVGYGHLVNAAGLHADRIAHAMGVGKRYRILPFKGLFRKLSIEKSHHVRGSIYPPPLLGMPFLGVHVTKNVYGDVFLGPTAIPAFGRENYEGWRGLDGAETPRILFHLAVMWLRDKSNFRALVSEEFRKYREAGFLADVQALMPGVSRGDVLKEGWAGLRAQLMDTQTGRLVMDFVVEDGPDSTHVLNAVSPAFTGSFPFAEILKEKIAAKRAA